MSVHLGQLYISIVGKLDKERGILLDEDFNNSLKPIFYVILLDSAFEFFVARAFEKLLEKKYNAPDAKRKLIGDLANNKIDYDLYCSILLPEIYRKSEILKKIKEKRNLGSHSRVFTKNGDYNPDCYLNEEQINQFTDTSKEIMKEIAEAIDSN